MKPIPLPIDPAYAVLLGQAVHVFACYEWTVIRVIGQYRSGFVARHSRGKPMPSAAVLQALRGVAADPNTPADQRDFLHACCATFDEMMDLRHALVHAHPSAHAGAALTFQDRAAQESAGSSLQWEPQRVTAVIARFDQEAVELNDFLATLMEAGTGERPRSELIASSSIPAAAQRNLRRRRSLTDVSAPEFELAGLTDITRLKRFLLTHGSLPRIRVATEMFPPAAASEAQARITHLHEADNSLTGALLAAALTLQAGLALMLMYLSRSWQDLATVALATLAAGLLGKCFTILCARVRLLRLLSKLRKHLLLAGRTPVASEVAAP